MSAIQFKTPAPDVYKDYILKKTFGWTQDELENESDADIHHYLYIMHQEAEQARTERMIHGE